MSRTVSSLLLTLTLALASLGLAGVAWVASGSPTSASAASASAARASATLERHLPARAGRAARGTVAPSSAAPSSAAPATAAPLTAARPTTAAATSTASPPPAPVQIAATGTAGACTSAGRNVVRPYPPGTTLSGQWEAKAPTNDVTYDLSGVTSTAYPSTGSPFAVGTGTPGMRTCVVGGTIRGRADDAQTWSYYHDLYNAACVRIIGTDWMQVHRLRCDNVEDGIRPLESAVNANNATIHVEGTYLSRIRDDCLENDYTVGGVLRDNLWEQCNTGISQRPSGGRSWSTPSSETLTLDHMLIGLYATPHVEGGTVVSGENALFKWSSSGNHLVIRCSTFKVDSVSLNGTSAMGLPPGTVVDDRACPNTPSTIVWLGGGAYPADPGGMRVVSDPAVWTGAVRAWKAAHGY